MRQQPPGTCRRRGGKQAGPPGTMPSCITTPPLPSLLLPFSPLGAGLGKAMARDLQARQGAGGPRGGVVWQPPSQPSALCASLHACLRIRSFPSLGGVAPSPPFPATSLLPALTRRQSWPRASPPGWVPPPPPPAPPAGAPRAPAATSCRAGPSPASASRCAGWCPAATACLAR